MLDGAGGGGWEKESTKQTGIKKSQAWRSQAWRLGGGGGEHNFVCTVCTPWSFPSPPQLICFWGLASPVSFPSSLQPLWVSGAGGAAPGIFTSAPTKKILKSRLFYKCIKEINKAPRFFTNGPPKNPIVPFLLLVGSCSPPPVCFSPGVSSGASRWSVWGFYLFNPPSFFFPLCKISLRGRVKNSCTRICSFVYPGALPPLSIPRPPLHPHRGEQHFGRDKTPRNAAPRRGKKIKEIKGEKIKTRRLGLDFLFLARMRAAKQGSGDVLGTFWKYKAPFWQYWRKISVHCLCGFIVRAITILTVW